MEAALHAEGCASLDRPNSICPLAQQPLFQRPWELFHDYGRAAGSDPDDFPRANRLQRTSLKLPVWHRIEDMPLVEPYLDAFEKVVTHPDELTVLARSAA